VHDSADKRVRERAIPLPPRCRTRVNSLDLPSCPFRAPGDPIAMAPGGERDGLLPRNRTRVVQGQEPPRAERAQPEPPVVGTTFTLELHAPETHAYPAVQAAKEVAATRERGGEVIRRATNDPVESRLSKNP
jgi:hypothetical protein